MVRFPEKERHQIFLEPEGLRHGEIYPNGVSTSPAARRAAGLPAHHARAGGGGDHAPRLRHRVRLRRPDPAAADPGDQGAARASTMPGRSTAPPATRRRRPRGSWPGSTPRSRCTGARAGDPRPRPGVYRRADRRPGQPRRQGAVPDVHLARRVPPAAARGQRRPAPERPRPPGRAAAGRRAGNVTAPSWRRWRPGRRGCARSGWRPAPGRRWRGSAWGC